MIIHPYSPRPCRPGMIDSRCWACNFGRFGLEGYGLWRANIRIQGYEDLVEKAEELGEFSITSLWEANGKGHPEFNQARHVVHDLWFHRLTEPVKVSSNGKVLRWSIIY